MQEALWIVLVWAVVVFAVVMKFRGSSRSLFIKKLMKSFSRKDFRAWLDRIGEKQVL
ncbi:hypothetical protein EV13_1651 [Prochlorococcus sp. MIT 0702]|nr:hypothetical protein EV12_1585 [Prochlorococcus sp. MIT 0701]KGG28239.1 hypothetical protein EV13_1651 [Prochlorococcus sp. MIT 0702]KGG31453.1 hypothetical protein EV14_2244 [Prochlorococcus sp. MIT 0703]